MSRSTGSPERGLTPVVGIVLLVAITMLLAATVAAFTLGLDEVARSDRIPTVAIGYEYDARDTGDELRIVHKSGKAVDVDAVDIVVTGARCVGGTDDPNGRFDLLNFGASGTLVAGESFEIGGSGPVECTSGGTFHLRPGTVRVIWIGQGGTSALLSEWDGPG